MRLAFLNLILVFTLLLSSCATHYTNDLPAERIPAESELSCSMLIEQILKAAPDQKASSAVGVYNTPAEKLYDVLAYTSNEKIYYATVSVAVDGKKLSESLLKANSKVDKAFKASLEIKAIYNGKFPTLANVEKAYASFTAKNQSDIFASSQQKASFLKWLATLKSEVEDVRSPMTNTDLKKVLTALANFEGQLLKESPFAEKVEPDFIRAMTNATLENLKLPPARLFDTDILGTLTVDQHVEKLLDGIVSSVALKEDLAQREILGLSLEQSPELLYPGFSRTVSVDLHKSGSKKVILDNRVALTDSRQWAAFVKAKLAKSKERTLEVKTNPSKVFRELASEFDVFLKKNNVDFVTGKGVTDEASLIFVDEDFINVFGKSFGIKRNLEAYNLKMENWFLKDKIWRGHAYGWQKFTDEDIADMFKNVHRQVASIQIGKKILGNKRTNDQTKIKKWVIDDFNRYNSDVADGEVMHLAKDHIETGPLYHTSYGYSTSKRYDVAKSFARGKTMANYGDVDTVQDQVNSRVLVGALRGKKDLDLNRLHRFDERFNYKYGRQQEVLGIGAADPDSVQIIQILNVEGEIAKTFWRDPKAPWRIVLIQGDWQEEVAPPAARIMKEYDLK